MIHLIPQPNGPIKADSQQWILPQTLSLCDSSFAPYCTEAFLARTGVKPGGGAPLRLIKDSRLPAEAYDLTISTAGIQATASSEAGIIWALTTVFCLLREGQLPCCTIQDQPAFPHRGVLLDCARHFFSCAEVKRVIEGISLAKINVLHWHLSDDQGWRIESKRFPLLQQTSGAYYTQQEIREIVEFARVRGVEILPELDMPGHTAGILAAYPQYSCSGKTVSLARTGGIYPIILCPGREETFRFLQMLLEEILPLFPGPRFHIGGDDFVLVTRPEHVERMCLAATRCFKRLIRACYCAEDRKRGEVMATGRDGVERVYPLVSLSIGILEIGGPCSLMEIGERAAHVKKYAKSIPGNVYAWDRRPPLGSQQQNAAFPAACPAVEGAA